MPFTVPTQPPVVESRAARRSPQGRQIEPVASFVRAADPAVILQVHAAALRRVRSDPVRPRRWSAPAFVAQVELIRRHLGPIRTTDMLAESFGREAGYLMVTGRLPHGIVEGILSGSPVDVAYALRWLELLEGRLLGPWQDWLRESATPDAGRHTGTATELLPP